MNDITKKTSFQSTFENYCEALVSEFSLISDTRKALLEKPGAYIAHKVKEGKDIKLVVICTHNSRRSHIGQLWLQAAAQWYGIPSLDTFSGGTEATAFNKNAIAALRRIGFEIEQEKEGENPIYLVNIPFKNPSLQSLFSKTFDSSPNPKKNFAAIMVCAEADIGCPFVPGADARFAIPFEDPKSFDGKENEAEEYDKSVRQIGREFFYVVNHASKLLK